MTFMPFNATTQQQSLGSMHALVVEDDRFFSETVSKTLSLVIPNVSLTLASTVRDAMAAVDTSQDAFKLAIVDLHLSNGDGVEAIRHIARKWPSTSILVLSVSSDEARVLEAIRAGATGYLVKGDVMLSLKSAVEQILCGANPLSPSVAGYFLRLAGRDALPDDGGGKPIPALTAREFELLNHIAAGKSYTESAKEMNISITTVRTHTTNLYRKLGVRSNIKALSVAKRHGIIKD